MDEALMSEIWDLESTKIRNLPPKARLTSIPTAFIWESLPPRGYLFTSKYHRRDFCKKTGCCNVTNNKATKIAKQTYKFQHSWLNKRSMSFCVTTEMWWPVYVEGEITYCKILCSLMPILPL